MSNSCSNPLDVGDTCFTSYGANVNVWCAFEVKGRIKASIDVLDASDHVLSSLPVTK